jgi:putative ABC transport system permease protein
MVRDSKVDGLKRMFYVAIQMLFGDWGKLFGILSGVAFAALLIVQQAGMFIGIMESSIAGVRDIPIADIWVMDRQAQFMDDIKPMLDKELHRVRGVAGVAWAVPYYRGGARARLPDGRLVDTFMIGLDDVTLTGGPYRMIEGKLSDLRRSQGIVVDRMGAEGRLAKQLPDSVSGDEPTVPLAVGDTLEMNDHRATVVGIVEAPKIWGDQPVIYTTYTRAVTYSRAERRRLSYVLVKCSNGEDPLAVCKRIEAQTGLKAVTSDGLYDMTLNYLLYQTSLPMTFGISVIFGFLIGTAVAGQMFYNFTTENLRYFGTLKAMGLGTGGAIMMVMAQAIVVTLLGWGIGIGLSSMAGRLLEDGEIGFRMPWYLFFGSIASVALITLTAATISLRRVITVEPAVVFRN